MTFGLSPAALAAGYRLEAHDTVGSTNAIALEHARAGDPGRLWVVAGKQESGRGRRGRPWESPPGNLAATVLMVERFELPLAATLGFVAGLALAEALDEVAAPGRIAITSDGGAAGVLRGGRFELKWPNDLLAGGAKLAGILLESSVLADARLAVAVGIGVNVVAHPVDTPYPATSLSALGSDADAEALFFALSGAFPRAIRVWDGGRGLSRVRRLWLARAAGLGSEVAVRMNGTLVRGVFETIDEDCRFVIRARNGDVVTVAAGDVHFGAVASAGAALAAAGE